MIFPSFSDVNESQYKVVLRNFINITWNCIEMLHVRYKSELLEDETQKLSADFQNYKSTKDMLFNELARARQEERDYLTNENLGLQSKVNILGNAHFQPTLRKKPTHQKCLIWLDASVGRALEYQSKGRGFESHSSRGFRSSITRPYLA